jgi:hypothetical protein
MATFAAGPWWNVANHFAELLFLKTASRPRYRKDPGKLATMNY